MEDLPLDQPPPQALPAPAWPKEALPVSSSPGGCLKGTSLTLGILSIAVSVWVIVADVSFYATYHRVDGSYGETILGLALFIVSVGLPFGTLPGVLSCVCAVVYSSRKPSKRGSARWPMLIGVLALVLGLVVLLLAFSPT